MQVILLSLQNCSIKSLVYVPSGISSGEKIRLPKKGYKTGFGDRGDLIAKVQIVMPEEISEEEMNLLKRLIEISKFNPRKDNID